MGSVQAFPRKGIHTIADVWRIAPMPTGVLRVREMHVEDCAAIRALQRASRPNVEPWSLRQLESQRHAFPEGQLVAEANGVIVGAASSLLVRWDEYAVAHTWRGITGDGTFGTHDPESLTLYGAELVVDTKRRGFGIARALFQARRQLCRRLNLRRVITAVRLSGYAAVRDEMSPELYAMRVLWGDLADPLLRFHMTQGFQYCAILHGYLPEDSDACGHAALAAWLNPLYTPPRPPAIEEPQRTRRCA